MTLLHEDIYLNDNQIKEKSEYEIGMQDQIKDGIHSDIATIPFGNSRFGNESSKFITDMQDDPNLQEKEITKVSIVPKTEDLSERTQTSTNIDLQPNIDLPESNRVLTPKEPKLSSRPPHGLEDTSDISKQNGVKMSPRKNNTQDSTNLKISKEDVEGSKKENEPIKEKQDSPKQDKSINKEHVESQIPKVVRRTRATRTKTDSDSGKKEDSIDANLKVALQPIDKPNKSDEKKSTVTNSTAKENKEEGSEIIKESPRKNKESPKKDIPIKRDNKDRGSPIKRTKKEEDSSARKTKKDSPRKDKKKQEDSSVKRDKKKKEEDDSPVKINKREDSAIRNKREKESPIKNKKEKESPSRNKKEKESPIRNKREKESPIRNKKEKESPIRNKKEKESPIRNKKEKESPRDRSQEIDKLAAGNKKESPKKDVQSASVKKSSEDIAEKKKTNISEVRNLKSANESLLQKRNEVFKKDEQVNASDLEKGSTKKYITKSNIDRNFLAASTLSKRDHSNVIRTETNIPIAPTIVQTFDADISRDASPRSDIQVKNNKISKNNNKKEVTTPLLENRKAKSLIDKTAVYIDGELIDRDKIPPIQFSPKKEVRSPTKNDTKGSHQVSPGTPRIGEEVEIKSPKVIKNKNKITAAPKGNLKGIEDLSSQNKLRENSEDDSEPNSEFQRKTDKFNAINVVSQLSTPKSNDLSEPGSPKKISPMLNVQNATVSHGNLRFASESTKRDTPQLSSLRYVRDKMKNKKTRDVKEDINSSEEDNSSEDSSEDKLDEDNSDQDSDEVDSPRTPEFIRAKKIKKKYKETSKRSEKTERSERKERSKRKEIPQRIEKKPFCLPADETRQKPNFEKLTKEERGRLKAELLTKLCTLREFWGDKYVIPVPDPDTDLEELYGLYSRYFQQTQIDNGDDDFKIYLFIFWGVLELVGTRILGLPMEGYTLNQVRILRRYRNLLTELGEKGYGSYGSSYPVEVRIILLSLFNGLVFLLVGWISGKVPAFSDLIRDFANNWQAGKGSLDAPKGDDAKGGSSVPAPEQQETGFANMIPGLLKMVGGAFGGQNTNQPRASRKPPH